MVSEPDTKRCDSKDPTLWFIGHFEILHVDRQMGLCCSKPDIKDEESEHHVEFGAGNVHLITTKVAWDQKLEEARSDGKITRHTNLEGKPLKGKLKEDYLLVSQVSGGVPVRTLAPKRGKPLKGKPKEDYVLAVDLGYYKWYQSKGKAQRGQYLLACDMVWSLQDDCSVLLRELSEKYPSLMFLVVDVDELSDFSTSWDIKATPTFFFLKDGQQIDKLVGANKPELQQKITAMADSLVPDRH
ncbi:hypothetical protein SDJN02_11541, partial [Cucurbita argyrosperma subsp. argyrosperma]